MPTRVYSVPTISCGHCETAIEKGVTDLADVTDVTVDIDARQVTVIGTSDVTTVTAAIEDAGYEVATVEDVAEPA